MSSNNDAVAIPMIRRNPSDLPEMDTSDLNALTGGAVLSFHNISYQDTEQSGFPFRKRKCVTGTLSNISGIMKPGLNAIMGPKDGSRSLLLDVLAARKDPCGLTGDILINGKPRPANFKCVSGYVPRDDVVMRTVTVRDNIEFSAALRLPVTITRDEKRRRVNEVLELLHLDHVANVQPRSEELRKRTSIAMELVVKHPILFLDDPTTGLDLSTTIDVIFVLRRMSMRGQTIIFSINQPQYHIFRCFDSLTLLASGKVMFHGPAQKALDYFTSAGYECDSHNNPADFFLDIISGGFSAILDTEEDSHEADKYKELSGKQHQVTENLADMYAQSEVYRDMSTELDQLFGEQEAGKSSALEEITCVTPFWHQLGWIIYHSFKNFKGFPRVTMSQAIITVILAVIVGIVFHFLQNDCAAVQNRAALLFLLTVFQCITSVSAGELFVIDRDRFLHEYSSGYYRVPSYFLGKMLAELVPRRLLPSFLLTIITFFIAGVQTDAKVLFTMLFTIMMLAYSTSSLPLSIGAGENAVAVPTLIVTIYFVFMLFFSGLSIYSGSEVFGHSWIQYINIPHYGFTALLHNEFLGQNFCPEHKAAEVSRCQNYVICTGEEFLMMQGIDLSSWSFWKNHVALACIMIILLSITYVRLLPHMKVGVLRATMLFLLTVLQCATSVSSGKLFVIGRDRFLHEHSSGYYRVSSYFLGKMLAELVPRRLLPSFLLTIIIFFIAGVQTDVKGFFIMLFTIMMLAYSTSSLPLSIGTGENAVAVRTLFVTIYFMFMLVFSGLSIYTGSIVVRLSWIQYINIPHYGFTALLHNEFLGQNFCPEHKAAEVSRCQNYVICTGEEFLMMQGIDLSSWGFWKNHVALACIMIILLSITYLQLLPHKKAGVLRSGWRRFQQFFKDTDD